MTHPDWQTTHHGRSTRQDFIGNGAPTVPEKCKQPRLNDVKDRCSGSLTGSVDAVATNAAPQEAEPVAWRWETVSEHIARDMAEGRFPEQSERQRVPAPAPAVPEEGLADRLQSIADKRHKDDVRVLTIADADVIAKAAAALRAQPAPQVKAQTTPIAAEGQTIDEMRANVRQHPRFNDLQNRGDVKLFWMVEAEAYSHLFSALSGEAQP